MCGSSRSFSSPEETEIDEGLICARFFNWWVLLTRNDDALVFLNFIGSIVFKPKNKVQLYFFTTTAGGPPLLVVVFHGTPPPPRQKNGFR